jgi:hypothetical protein
MSEIDTLDDIYTEEPVEVEVEPEAVEEPVAEEATEEAPKEAEPEGKTTVPKENEWTLTAVMDEREKRQAAVKKAEELEARLAEFERKTEEEVSIFTDEEAWKAQQENKVQQELRNTALNMSQAFAEEVFGPDKVAQAAEWMKNEGIKSPYSVSRFNSAKLPFHEAVKMFDEEQARLDPDAYKAKLKAEIMEELKQVPEEDKPDPIPSSLASKRSAGKATETSEDWDDILG